MPRTTSIDSLIDEAVEAALSRSLPGIQRAINRAVEARLREELASAPKAGRSKGRRGTRSEISRWVADRRARRVPNLVIDATELNTKKAIVAKYGVNATFAKGKPVPPEKLTAFAKEQTRAPGVQPVKAKAPIIRKRAAASK